jgi:hypothetical protein
LWLRLGRGRERRVRRPREGRMWPCLRGVRGNAASMMWGGDGNGGLGGQGRVGCGHACVVFVEMPLP